MMGVMLTGAAQISAEVHGGRLLRRWPGSSLVAAILVLGGCGGDGTGTSGDTGSGTAVPPGGSAGSTVPAGSNTPVRTTGRLAVAEVAGTVDFGGASLPTDIASYGVRTAAGRRQVSTDARVSTLIFAGGPQYAELLDGSGRTVMLGFVTPAEPTLSALSTAKALGYLALAGAWMKEEARLKLLAELPTLAGFPMLQGVVQQQLRDMGRLDLDKPELRSAIQLLVSSAYGPNPVATASAQRPTVRAQGVVADQTTASGLSLDTTVDSQLTVENVYLRRVSLFVRRNSYVNAAGQQVDETNPFTRIDLPNVARYGGITGTLDGYFKGEVAYSPVRTTPPLDIPRFPGDAKSTLYQIFAIGPGFSSHPNLNVPADIIAAQQLLEVKALFLDAFVVLLANVALPLKGDQIDQYLEFASANAVITDIIGTLKNTMPDVVDKLAAGDYYAALQTLLTSAYTSNSILPAVGQVTLDFLWANTQINEDDYEMMFSGMKGMLDKLGKIDVGFTLADTFLLFRDIGKSKRIEQFLVTTTPGKVTLVAGASSISYTSTTTIDAVVQDRDPNGVYEFRWTVSPRPNYWVEDRTLAGTDDAPDGVLVTREDRVNIRSLVSTEGVATVQVEAFRLDGGRRQVGDGSTTVKFTRVTQVVTTHANFQGISGIFQQSDGRYTAVIAAYVDLPLSANVSQYVFERQQEGGGRWRGGSINPPLTKGDFFEASDSSNPSVGARGVISAQAGTGTFR
ncbi:MAG: hypothetical protein ABW278_15195, partial [Steroidobacteraceae bacterium]